MNLKVVIFIVTSLIFSPAYALFCPNDFDSINMGDSIETVESVCGKAISKTVNKRKPPEPQEWVYYLAIAPGMPGTIKTTIAFDALGKVINISVNGAGVSQTQICNNTMIQFGDTQDNIKSICGAPAYINPTSSPDSKPQEIETTRLIYNSDPPTALVFENDKLIKRE